MDPVKPTCNVDIVEACILKLFLRFKRAPAEKVPSLYDDKNIILAETSSETTRDWPQSMDVGKESSEKFSTCPINKSLRKG